MHSLIWHISATNAGLANFNVYSLEENSSVLELVRQESLYFGVIISKFALIWIIKTSNLIIIQKVY